MEEKEALSLLLDRRSVRKYSGVKITRETLIKLVEAGMYAPSAHNQQPWHFIIMDDPAIFHRIPEFHPYSRMIKEAAAVILTAGNRQHMKSEEFWPQDLAAATENILLAAEALGLGAVWLGVYPRESLMEKLTKLCRLPEHILPFSLISLGYPVEKLQRPNRFQEERIDFNLWREK